MAGVITKGELQSALDELAPDLYEIHLFVNNVTPTADSVIGDFVEPSFDTYNPQTLSWNPSTLVTSDDANAVSSFALFGPEGDHSSTNVYGWYVLDHGSVLVAAGRFAGAPLVIDDTNPALVVQGALDLENA